MFRRWRDWHYGVECSTSILRGLHPVIALRVSNLVGPYPGWLLVSFSSYRNLSGVLIRGLLMGRYGDCRPLNEFALVPEDSQTTTACTSTYLI
jgi:hypothetical protein